MSNREQYTAFMRGWTDGASARSIREEFALNPELTDAYHEGYDAGYAARNMARERAEKRFDHQVTILHTPEPIGYDMQQIGDQVVVVGIEWKST